MDFYSMLKFNQAILEKLPVALLLTDTNCRIINANGAAQNLFFGTPLKNRDLEGLFMENPFLLDQLSQALQKQSPTSLIGVSFRSAKENKILNIVSYPVIDNTQLLGHILIINDVTEQEFLRQQVIVSEKMASVGLLAAGIAHEINNPLEIITNCLDSIRIYSENNPNERYFDYIEEEIDRISEIITNLISYSKADSGSSLIYIPDVILEITELITPYAKVHRTKVTLQNAHEYTGAENQEILEAYSSEINGPELKQVLLNVLKNAIDAVKDGPGKVDILLKTVRHEDLPSVQIIIEDNGKGIEEEDLQKVFMPFYSRSERGGTGLGLYISYQILAKYSGRIYFEKREVGTRCVIELPASR